MPWPELCAVIAPFYPKGEGGCPAIALERKAKDFTNRRYRCLCASSGGTPGNALEKFTEECMEKVIDEVTKNSRRHSHTWRAEGSLFPFI